ncbi:receiver box response regulator [Natronomonas pharaonis DSM 2160]|uniref:Receiver box response regulator n=1 Tax=Natronomonas pharaonis (strain ATCC 35678 / DSM 2160 / CIP 103997 / JCM 8858 / NBRC 14720 / NCIMB 2260 / Gabara) TaxID=348780 RepID=A0A1U7ET93_NATPD|nr:HalX domain-containing protein [Natronomonas pharaonis]CAI48105.1 receiver box response regulator [Natronomonas pharaonis DSM 2160]
MTDEQPTVLVVDDEPELTDLYATWLESGYDVRTAYGGPEAVERLNEDIDVALVDRLMPQTSGDEVLDHVRAADYDCRVAMVTSVEPDFDIIDLSFDEYAVKPVRKDELESVVEALVARSEYDSQVQRLFALASKRAALRAEKADEKLEQSDAYQQLTADIDQLQSELEATLSQLDARDLEAEMQRLIA